MDIKYFGTKEIILSNGKRLCYLIKCDQCEILHYKAHCEIIKGLQRNKKFFCSRACHAKYHSTSINVECANCNLKFLKLPSQINKTKNNFCSKSCAATFNNKNKQYGIRRSKLELIIEQNLLLFFPNLQFICNNKSIIGSELDFYFPEIKIAIQISGILHYEPIYGLEKLRHIQNLDQEKRNKCLEKNIKLFEINCKDDKYLSKRLQNERWVQVKEIVEGKGFEPLRDFTAPICFPGKPHQPLAHPSIF